MAAQPTRRRTVLTVLLAVAGALFGAATLYLLVMPFPAHRWMAVVAVGLALLLGVLLVARRVSRRRPALDVGVGILSVALAASLIVGGITCANDLVHMLILPMFDAAPQVTGCGPLGRDGGPWDARATQAVKDAFPGYPVRLVRGCQRFVAGGDREVRVRVGRLVDPHLDTQLVVEERVTFGTRRGRTTPTLAPYADAVAARRDLARLDATPGLAKHLGAGARVCLLHYGDVVPVLGWELRCIPRTGLGRPPEAPPGWPTAEERARCRPGDLAHDPCFSATVQTPPGPSAGTARQG